MAGFSMKMEEKIRQKLKESLSPSLLKVINESQLHAGHVGDDGSGESHFRIEIMSSAFDGVSRVNRERLVHQALSDEMPCIHALSIQIMA